MPCIITARAHSNCAGLHPLLLPSATDEDPAAEYEQSTDDNLEYARKEIHPEVAVSNIGDYDCGYRPIHESGQTGLNNPQDKSLLVSPARVFLLGGLFFQA